MKNSQGINQLEQPNLFDSYKQFSDDTNEAKAAINKYNVDLTQAKQKIRAELTSIENSKESLENFWNTNPQSEQEIKSKLDSTEYSIKFSESLIRNELKDLLRKSYCG